MADTNPKTDTWGNTPEKVLDDLLSAEGIKKFASFKMLQTGEHLPGGLHTVRWLILTPDEMVRSCLLEWNDSKPAPDGSKGYYALRIREWTPEDVFMESMTPSYVAAREKLNLPLEKEQTEILNAAQKK